MIEILSGWWGKEAIYKHSKSVEEFNIVRSPEIFATTPDKYLEVKGAVSHYFSIKS